MIRAQNLSKYFGDKRALGPVSFEIEENESVGFLGLNGAGKTTALRIFACDLRPSSGTVNVGNVDAVANPHAVRRKIGFLPETPPVYADMHVAEYLRFAGRLRGMSPREVEKRIPIVLELTHLANVKNEIISTLSHGYRQRVGVGQAIIHEPALLILDEPTRGLDPVQIIEMRSMIQDLKEKHTVLISSHIFSEIEKTCDRILVLQAGEIVATGHEKQLAQQMKSATSIEVAVAKPGAPQSELREKLEKIEGVTKTEIVPGSDDELTFRLTTEKDVRAQVCRTLVGSDVDVLSLNRAAGELESIFLKLVKGVNDASN